MLGSKNSRLFHIGYPIRKSIEKNAERFSHECHGKFSIFLYFCKIEKQEDESNPNR